MLWISALCSLPTVGYEMFRAPPGAGQKETIITGVVGLIVAYSIAYFLNGAAWKGKNWSRWALGILTALSTLALTLILYKLPRLAPTLVPWYVITQYVVQTVLNIIAVGLLCSPGANAWYQAVTVARSRAV
jgi:hypothetical protein